MQRKRSKNQEMFPPTRRAEVGESATSVEVRSTWRMNAVACAEAWTEHQTRSFEERGVSKGAMLVKINVPVNAEVGLIRISVRHSICPIHRPE